MDELKERLTAVGITCGVGSMLVGARDAGFAVEGNIEWRRYYSRPDDQGRRTFTENFPGAVLRYKINELEPDELERLTGCDVALGHPECGNFSKLSAMNPDKTSDPADIPLFVDLVSKLKPTFFVMDDLPKSLNAFTMADYAERLPDYDLFPEWVSNYGYGNVQKNRNRMFMIGALKSERWTFVPGEVDHDRTMQDVLGDLPEPGTGDVANHERHTLEERCGRAKHLESLGRDREATYRDLRDYTLSRPEGATLGYIAKDGTVKRKPGHARAYWDGHAHVLDGASVQTHPVRGTPFTVRERARLQGFPDDFVFVGPVLNERGEYNHERNSHLVKQTGKAMPVQFCRYVCYQIYFHLIGGEWVSSGERILRPNPDVDRAKFWYCENVGYADQGRACGSCWLYDRCAIRASRYGIGAVPLAPEKAAPPEPEQKPGRRTLRNTPRLTPSPRYRELPENDEPTAVLGPRDNYKETDDD